MLITFILHSTLWALVIYGLGDKLVLFGIPLDIVAIVVISLVTLVLTFAHIDIRIIALAFMRKDGPIPPKNLLLSVTRIVRRKRQNPFLSNLPAYSSLVIAAAITGLGYPILGVIYGTTIVLVMLAKRKLVTSLSDITTLERIYNEVRKNES